MLFFFLKKTTFSRFRRVIKHQKMMIFNSFFLATRRKCSRFFFRLKKIEKKFSFPEFLAFKRREPRNASKIEKNSIFQAFLDFWRKNAIFRQKVRFDLALFEKNQSGASIGDGSDPKSRIWASKKFWTF